MSSTPFQLLLCSPLLMSIVQDSCHRCQHTQSGCVPSSTRSRNCIGNRPVDFLIFCSRPKMLFNSVGAEDHTRLHCTTHGTFFFCSSILSPIFPPHLLVCQEFQRIDEVVATLAAQRELAFQLHRPPHATHHNCIVSFRVLKIPTR